MSYTSPGKSYELYMCKGTLYEQTCVCPVSIHVLCSLRAGHIMPRIFSLCRRAPPPCSMAGHLDRVLLSLCFLVPTNLGLSSEISYAPPRPPPCKDTLLSGTTRTPQSSYDVTRREQMRVVPDENMKGEKIKDSALAPSPPLCY